MLRRGRVDAPAGDLPVWVDVDLPLLTAAEGRRRLLQVAAEIEPGAALRVGMVQGNRYEAGRLWVNGALTWPEQDLEFVAHGAAEPTRSKLGSLWQLVSSDWRWAALAIEGRAGSGAGYADSDLAGDRHVAQVGRGWDTIGVALRIALESRHGGR